MTLIKRTLANIIVNLLIIVSFFVFVNCFGKQEMWPVMVSGAVFASILMFYLYDKKMKSLKIVFDKQIALSVTPDRKTGVTAKR